jgi:hypothetical protein
MQQYNITQHDMCNTLNLLSLRFYKDLYRDQIGVFSNKRSLYG